MRRASRAVVPPAAVWASRATRAPVPVPAALFCVNGVTACVCGVPLPLATRPPCLCRETPSSASRWPPSVPSSVAGLSAAFRLLGRRRGPRALLGAPCLPPARPRLGSCALAVRPPRAQCERWVTATPSGSTAAFGGPSRVLPRFLFRVIGRRALRLSCGWRGRVVCLWRPHQGRRALHSHSPCVLLGPPVECHRRTRPEACVLVEVTACPSHPGRSDFAISAVWQSHRRGVFLALLARGCLSIHLTRRRCPE